MKRIAIIGGGIAGLSAAFYLEKARRAGTDLQWALFEKSDRLGGVIQTERRDGFVIEAGPDSFLSIKPDAARLCQELGLGDQLINSNDASRKTYILVKSKLVAIPQGLEFMVPTRIWPMATTPLFSFSTKLRMAAELFSSARKDAGDEPVGDFVRRHFGQEMVDRVAEPLLAGVYGGNAERLSIRAVLPRFAEMERQHGSLVRATLKAKAQFKSNMPGGAKPQPLFTSLKHGMQQMVEALVAVLPQASIRMRQQNLFLRPVNDDWQIESGGNAEKFQAVLLAVPAPAAAGLLRQFHPALIEGLARIEYTSSAVVALAYDQAELPAGHGFLVPQSESRKIMACTFVHKKFPYRAPGDKKLLRCFFSSSRMPDLLAHSDETLQQFARQELKNILGLTAEPRFARTFRWDRAMAQYETGHLDRVAEMEKIIAEMPGFHIIGNSFHGIGVPDCIKCARLAVEQITSGVSQPATA
ncbi:MAG TPA: protoporphyrinogen oxidase [Candidatus Acidoferrales bacterium]|nr:protoporphyrinogen oxidase [Candidatus Acidoferrales bacterium]